MARKIRFPLKMKNGAEVRTLEDLRENFDLESVLGYFTDGKLATWLADRYYDEKAEAVAALSKDMPDLNAKICEILEVEYQEKNDDTDLEYIQRRNEKYRILSAKTDDREILDNIDIVALNQVDLYDVLDRCNEKVYLYENKFEIPFGRKNICYIGLSPDRVVVSIEKGKYLFEYIDAGITFHNIEFDSSINQYVTKGEILLKNNKYEEAIPLINEAIKENNIRAYFWGKILSDLDIGNIEINEEIDISDFKDIPSDSAENLILTILNDDEIDIDIDDTEKLKDDAFSGDFIAAFLFILAKLADNSIDNEIIEMIELNNNALLYCFLAEWLEEDGSEENIVIKYYEKSYKLGLYASLVKLFDLDYISEDDVKEPDIQYHLGKEYYNSDEDDEAVKWFIKAAEQGNADALAQLSIMIHEDKTIFDDTEAVRWYKLVAEQGYAEAQYELGDCYYYGYYGVEKDYVQAAEWYRKAAEQGYAEAQYILGNCYYLGEGVEEDDVQAFEWYRKAAEQGDEYAQKSLGDMYKNGYGVTPDKKTAEEWYCKAAEQGNVYIQYELGYMYEMGYGIEQDYAKAVKWYRKAAEQGYAAAQCSLGYMYENGYGIEQDKAKAVEWYRKAAEQGNARGQYNLGFMYDNGYGIEQDKAKAAEWYRKAAEQGLSRAQFNLGYDYQYGEGVTQDYAEAVKWYRKAAEQEYAKAQLNLGFMYDKGYGVTQDKAKAIELYKKAAAQGNEIAKNNLKNLGVSI